MAEKNKKYLPVGQGGEYRTLNVLENSLPPDYRIVKDRVIGGRAENDFSIYGPAGFRHIDVKDWNNPTYGRVKDFRVANVNPKTGQQQSFYNPYKQGESHNETDKSELGLNHNQCRGAVLDINGNMKIRGGSRNIDYIGGLESFKDYINDFVSGETVLSPSNLYRLDKKFEEQENNPKNNRSAYVKKLKQKYK